jgi:hypothetical protein
MLSRTEHEASPSIAFTDNEIGLLDRLVGDADSPRAKLDTLGLYLIKLARSGGYLARAGDAPPGSVVAWRGLSRLTNIEIGAELGGTAHVDN